MFKVPRIGLAGVCAVMLLTALSFTHPYGNPQDAKAPPGQLLAGAQIPDPLRQLLQSKCGNCHSETVEWPFYSRIAPMSWLVGHDISEARKHMNLSRWDAYSDQDKMDLLARLGAKARSGEMPPFRYTAIHRDSKLLKTEQDAVYGWARGERKRLREKNQARS